MNFADGNFDLKEIQTLKGHTDRIWSPAWNPASGVDGVPAIICSCSADKTVRIWEQNPYTDDSFFCKAVLKGQHAETVRWCVWSPNGKLLATSSFDGDTAIWENDNFSCIDVLQEVQGIAPSISWNASGTLLATSVPCIRISIWKASSTSNKIFGSASMVLTGVENVKTVQWHPLKDTLFSSGFDGTIKVWEKKVNRIKWACVQTLGEPNSESSNTVRAFAFNGSADKMVSCSDDGTIKIWGSEITKTQYGEENTLWTCLCTVSGHDRRIFSIHWSREGIICCGSFDKAIHLYFESEDDLVYGPTYQLLLKKELAHSKDINAVQWNSMGNRRLASASDDRTVKIWELISSS